MAAAIVLGVVLLALVLFWTEWVPVEVTSLIVVLLLALSGVLTPEEAFSGFSNDTVVFIFTLLTMAQGLAATGAVQAIGDRLAAVARLGPRAFMLALLAVVAAFSSFISNTVTIAAFLPVAVSGAARARVPKRTLLLPLSFASMLGGTILLFGTSTNLVMSAAMERSGLGAIGVTELAPLGLPIALVGIVVVALIAPPLLRAPSRDSEPQAVPERAYLAEAVVGADSPHVGKTLRDVGPLAGARPVGVVRDGETLPPDEDAVLSPDDRVVLEGKRAEIVEAAHLPGIAVGTGEPTVAAGASPAADDERLVVEASVPPGSRLAGRSVDDPRGGGSLGLEVLAIHRRPTVQRFTKLQLLSRARRAPSLTALPLAVGDLLLLRGPRHRVLALADGAVLLLLTHVADEPPRRGRRVLAALLFAGALGVGSAGLLPLAVAGLAGTVAMIATGCVDARRAFRIDWRVVLLVGSMLALGLAMEKSGAGQLFGERVATLGTFAGPRGVLLAVMVLTILLSGPMSNQAAALVMLPVAVAAAGGLGVDPRPFAIGVTLAGSCSFVTPLEPASMLVYGVGRYRFADFVRVGLPLTIVVVAMLVAGVPAIWPLHGR